MMPWAVNAKPNSLRGKLFNRYTGPGNNVKKQVDFNECTGKIYKVYDPPSSNNDKCSMIHDIMYTFAENIGRDSKDIKNRKLNADKEWLDCFKPRTPYDMIAYSSIKTKKKLGLGNDFNMEDLSDELNKPVINKFPSMIPRNDIERFNRSLRELMMKEFVKNNNTVWYNILSKLIKFYNNRCHNTIKDNPINMNKSNKK